MSGSLGIVTFLKAFSLLISSLHSRFSGRNPRFGYLGSNDSGTVDVVLPLGASFLVQLLEGGREKGRVVCIYHVDVSRSQRHGATGSWRHTCHDGLMQEGTLTGAMLASMAGLERIFTLIYTLEMG
jgi:hypothetical protein